MIIEKKNVEKDYASCNFCRCGEYADKKMIFPYKEVLEIRSGFSGGITISMCPNCIDEFLLKIKETI